jgi:hypothetical protein
MALGAAVEVCKRETRGSHYGRRLDLLGMPGSSFNIDAVLCVMRQATQYQVRITLQHAQCAYISVLVEGTWAIQSLASQLLPIGSCGWAPMHPPPWCLEAPIAPLNRSLIWPDVSRPICVQHQPCLHGQLSMMRTCTVTDESAPAGRARAWLARFRFVA